MEIIGEASNHISEETKSKFSSIQWAQIIGMRNVFVHEIAINISSIETENDNKGYTM
jgi:uncharacterized protein with HEPN domain